MNHLLEEALKNLRYPAELRPEILDFARQFTYQGHQDSRYILKRVRRRFGSPPPLVELRDKPAPLSVALEARSDLERKNLFVTERKIHELLVSPVALGGALMPDAGVAGSETASLPVGGILATRDALVPSAHSADICCSVRATFFESALNISTLMDRLQANTRFGPGGRDRESLVPHPVLDEAIWHNPFLSDLKPKAEMHLCDQGDGNHFASLGAFRLSAKQRELMIKMGHTDLAEQLWGKQLYVLTTHHGSRGLGASVFKRGQAAAVKHTHQLNPKIPPAACWIKANSAQGQDYWKALQYVARWTQANHQVIHERFLTECQADSIADLGNEHNFVWKRDDTYLHAKGATPAWPDELGRPRLGLIPLSMRDPILIVAGQDNSDYFSFAPHGAGRNQSRTAYLKSARRASNDPNAFCRQLEAATQGVDVRWFSGKPDITETAGAYKSAQEIRRQIEKFKLATVVGEIQPLGCIMAGRSKSWRELKEDHFTPKQRRQMQHRAQRRKGRQARDWLSED